MNNDTNDIITELARQNVILKTFVRTIIKENCFGYDGEVDGLDVQDQAANCGIILPETVTREMVEEWERTQSRPGDFDEGDVLYNFAPWMTDEQFDVIVENVRLENVPKNLFEETTNEN